MSDVLLLVSFLLFMQLLQRAEDLESLRKSKGSTGKSKSPHEQAVDHYAAYITSQMYLIPEEQWFKFTVDNMSMIQAYVTRRHMRPSVPEFQAQNYMQTFQQDLSHAQMSGIPLQQPVCTPRPQTSTQFFNSPGCAQTAACAQVPQSGPCGQSLMTPQMSLVPSTAPTATVSPSSFLNLQTPTFTQMSTQLLMSGSSTCGNLEGSTISVAHKSSATAQELKSGESSNVDVMSFSDQLF